MEFKIRKALPDESIILTEISFLSKHYWGYPDEYFDIWKHELTITPEYIKHNHVFAAYTEEEILGYFSLVEVAEYFVTNEVGVDKGFWLEHIFIRPEYMRMGIGKKLIAFMQKYCRENNISELHIFSDPNADGFYDSIGAEYVRNSPSSIQGRNVSLYRLTI